MDKNILRNIFGAGEIGKVIPFLKRSLHILIGVTLFDISIKTLVGNLFLLSKPVSILLLVSSYIIPIIINTVIFIFHRYSLSLVRFSKKTNLVFAYNLEGINQEKFSKKYNNLISDVKNEINNKNLGDKIAIKVTPSDINLKEKTAAEAKVLLGLKGATILIWGHAVKKNGEIKFATRFSYEFSHPKNQNPKEAKTEMEVYINKIMSKGLFIPIKMDLSNFVDQTLPTIFFILGLTTLTMNLIDKSEEYLLAFKQYYNEADILRKRDLSAALMECNDMLYSIYKSQLPYITAELTEQSKIKANLLAIKMLDIKPNDYDANLVAAYINDLNGNKSQSQHYSEIAEKNAPKREHAHIFNKAYFALTEKNYPEAIRLYNSIPVETNVVATDISSYLNERYKKTKELAFLFADGYVSLKWGDSDLGKVSLQKFLSLADPVTHKTFINELKKHPQFN